MMPNVVFTLPLDHFKGQVVVYVSGCDVSPSVERLFGGLVRKHRPELGGSAVRCVALNIDARRWEILVYHPSLPAAASDPVPLIPQEAAPHVVGG